MLTALAVSLYIIARFLPLVNTFLQVFSDVCNLFVICERMPLIFRGIVRILFTSRSFSALYCSVLWKCLHDEFAAHWVMLLMECVRLILSGPLGDELR